MCIFSGKQNANIYYPMYHEVEQSFQKLHCYCLSQNFKGYDPYDGLSSKLFNRLPLANKNRMLRLIWIQAFKKFPVNLRLLVGIKKEHNPKALALFLSGYTIIYSKDPKQEYRERIDFFIERLFDLASHGYSGMCWGYNFDWESRAFFLKKYTPTIVVSSYVANALLDAYSIFPQQSLFDAARSTCDFIIKDLNRNYDKNGDFLFSYSPLDRSAVYNASLLGSRLLARVYSLTGEKVLKDEAEKAARCVCNNQNIDGSWYYGKQKFHRWIDNFHTGFNLECLNDYQIYTGDYSFKENIETGYRYYLKTFFTSDGVSKYYNNRVFPVDVHAPAQLVVTVCKLGCFEKSEDIVDRVLHWTIMNMQNDSGLFFYQIRKYYKIRISYMRWSQAWMFYSMAHYLYKNPMYADYKAD